MKTTICFVLLYLLLPQQPVPCQITHEQESTLISVGYAYGLAVALYKHEIDAGGSVKNACEILETEDQLANSNLGGNISQKTLTSFQDVNELRFVCKQRRKTQKEAGK
jgi:hypothetical protein